MEYIINGKKYDTESSVKLCRHVSSKGQWGVSHIYNLYVTEKRNFFLEVKVEDITPKKVKLLTEKETKEFMKKNAAGVDVEIYERIFGETEKG